MVFAITEKREYDVLCASKHIDRFKLSSDVWTLKLSDTLTLKLQFKGHCILSGAELVAGGQCVALCAIPDMPPVRYLVEFNLVAESSALMWRQVAERKRTAALRALPTKLTQHRSSRSSALRIPPKQTQRRRSKAVAPYTRPQVTPCRIWDGGNTTRALRPGESRPTMGLTPVPTRVGTGSLTQGRIVVSTEVLLPGLVPLRCRGVRWYYHPHSAQGRKVKE